MTQLALAVDTDDELWTLDALPTPEAPYVEVGSELIEVRARFPSQTYTLTGETLPPRIRVRRGIAGTTAAAHDIGVTLTPTYGLGSGVGAGGVPDPSGAPDGQVVVTADGAYELSTDVGVALTASRTLSSAELLALHTTPVVLVEQVADRLHWPIAAFFLYRAGANAYTFTPLLTIQIGLQQTTGYIPMQGIFDDVIGGSNDAFGSLGPTMVNGYVPFGELLLAIGDALVVRFDGAVADGEGTLDVVVLYHTVDVS